MNNNEMNYHEKVKINQTKKLREVMETLPIFCKSFFLGMNSTMSARTKLGYALDLRIFFDFLHDNNPTLKTQDVRDFKIEILDQVTKDDIEEYMEYLTYYEKNGKAHKDPGIGRTDCHNGRISAHQRHQMLREQKADHRKHRSEDRRPDECIGKPRICFFFSLPFLNGEPDGTSHTNHLTDGKNKAV